jgi:hypothetical protein
MAEVIVHPSLVARLFVELTDRYLKSLGATFDEVDARMLTTMPAEACRELRIFAMVRRLVVECSLDTDDPEGELRAALQMCEDMQRQTIARPR